MAGALPWEPVRGLLQPPDTRVTSASIVPTPQTLPLTSLTMNALTRARNPTAAPTAPYDLPREGVYDHTF